MHRDINVKCELKYYIIFNIFWKNNLKLNNKLLCLILELTVNNNYYSIAFIYSSTCIEYSDCISI